jgi:hypothetical protein
LELPRKTCFGFALAVASLFVPKESCSTFSDVLTLTTACRVVNPLPHAFWSPTVAASNAFTSACLRVVKGSRSLALLAATLILNYCEDKGRRSIFILVGYLHLKLVGSTDKVG